MPDCAEPVCPMNDRTFAGYYCTDLPFVYAANSAKSAFRCRGSRRASPGMASRSGIAPSLRLA